MSVPVPPLHALTDQRILGLPDLADRAAAIGRSVRVAIHCRHAPTGRAALSITETFQAAVHGRGARVLVNDRADVARVAAADGVHLPARGLSVRDARRIAGTGALVGRSVRDVDGVRAALDEGADYAMLGPIWPTASHPDREPLGPGALEAAAALGLPVMAVGGLTAARAAECAAAGAAGVGVIRAVWDAPDPGSAADRFLLSFPA